MDKNGIEVWVYTRLANGKTIEHHGILHKSNGTVHQYERKASFNNSHSNHWMTSLSNDEGVVRGHSIWFRKPSRRRAIEALNAKDKERINTLLEKANRTLQRIEA